LLEIDRNSDLISFLVLRVLVSGNIGRLYVVFNKEFMIRFHFEGYDK